MNMMMIFEKMLEQGGFIIFTRTVLVHVCLHKCMCVFYLLGVSLASVWLPQSPTI